VKSLLVRIPLFDLLGVKILLLKTLLLELFPSFMDRVKARPQEPKKVVFALFSFFIVGFMMSL